jgi:hypothetical protein
MTWFDRIAHEVSTESEGRSTRSAFLKKLSKVSLAATAIVTGLARVGTAEARVVACCNLGSNTDCPCRGCCSCSGNKSWTWGCVASDGRVWECGECYTGSTCNTGPYCCSWAYVGGLTPAH